MSSEKSRPKPEKKHSKPLRKPTPDARPKTVAAVQDEGAGERIQKVLARGGVGSRREIERWIEEGRVMVNGAVAALGARLLGSDTLQINGRYVDWQKFDRQPTRVLLYHKPTGEVVTRRDPEGRPVIFTQLPKLTAARWIAVGRLDINTSGLLLVTNNGELANRLMHPKTQIEREYAVRILGEVSEATIEKLKQGVELEDGLAKFNDVRFYAGEGANKWYYVTVSEGRNRLVRRLWESQQVVVSRLMRVRYGPVVLPERLKAHSFYELSDKELDILFEFADLPRDNVAAQPKAESKGGRYGKK
jgi:23S rRNA pseudouridine2605 synthase